MHISCPIMPFHPTQTQCRRTGDAKPTSTGSNMECASEVQLSSVSRFLFLRRYTAYGFVAKRTWTVQIIRLAVGEAKMNCRADASEFDSGVHDVWYAPRHRQPSLMASSVSDLQRRSSSLPSIAFPVLCVLPSNRSRRASRRSKRLSKAEIRSRSSTNIPLMGSPAVDSGVAGVGL